MIDFGTLHLGSEAFEAASPILWSDCTVNRILLLVTAILFLITLSDYINLWPMLTDCLVRSRGNVSMEHSLGDARNRNTAFYISLLCFCLLADRYHLLGTGIAESFRPEFRVAVTAALIIAYLLLRYLIWALILIVEPPGKADSEMRAVMHKGPRNYFIVAVALMLVAVAILSPFGTGETAVRVALWAILGVMFLYMLVRIGQIFRTHCSYLATFLYLCTLEILPLGALTVAALFMQDIV